MKTYKVTLSILLLFAFSIGAMARVEVKKEYHEKYTTSKGVDLIISNKYGEVVITNTDIDEMSIDVVVRVESSSQQKSQAIIDEIMIEIDKSGNTITAKTVLEGKLKWNNVKVDIDYSINMPRYVNTKLDLRYGDATIAEIFGSFDAEVRYGNFRANVLMPSTNYTNSLRMAYCGQVSIKAFGKMNLDLSYSDAKIGGGEALNLDCRYSDIKIGDVAIVKAELGYSDMDLSSTLEATLEAKYSDIDFGVINKSLVLETKYGDIDVDVLGKNFELVKVDAGYSDVAINVEGGASYKLDLAASYGDISFPKINVTDVDKEGTSQFIRGYVQDAQSTNMLMVESRYGDIDVRSM